MPRPRLPLMLALLAALVSLLSAATPRPRNIVLIVADDLSQDAGCYGNREVRTPAMDQLAREGTLFRNAFCTSASCSASRSVILTGLQNHATGHYGHAHSEHHFSTYRAVRSLPVLLGEHGYRTGRVGKYHVAPRRLTASRPSCPRTRGTRSRWPRRAERSWRTAAGRSSCISVP